MYVLGWIVRRAVNDPDRIGVFGYLAIRDRNRCQVELEHARQEAAKDLIECLPCGAVYREGTADSWREIWMPPAPRSPLFVIPASTTSRRAILMTRRSWHSRSGS
jgi:hypothetical protein